MMGLKKHFRRENMWLKPMMEINEKIRKERRLS